MISKNHITFIFISKYFTFIFIICSHSNEKVTAQTFFFFFLIKGIFIVFAILLFLHLFFSKLPPFPLQNSRGEEQVLPPSPKASSSITHLPPSLFPSCAIYCLVPLAPFSQSRRKMNSLGSRVQPHPIDQLREPQSTEFTSPKKPACIGQLALHSFI